MALKALVPPPERELDWPPGRARDLTVRLLGIWEELLADFRGLPVARSHSYAEVRRALARTVPDDPLPLNELVEYVRQLVFEHSTYVGHPRFMAYITGAGTVPGAAAHLIAAALNQNVGAWRLSPGATEIEVQLVRWFADQFELPTTAGGLLTPGGAVATLTALKVARDSRAEVHARLEGLSGSAPLTLYASEEVHAVVDRAADMLGIGCNAVRHLPTDADFRLRVDALRDAIALDRRCGRRPFAVVATAGTVATGAIDPLEDVADLCAEQDLWLHIDAAYGGACALAPQLRALVAGIERADSIALDFHKWLYCPLPAGCLMVRDLRGLAESFAIDPTYQFEDKDRTERGPDLRMFGPQFSRGFAALGVWLSLLAHGRAAYARRIAHDVQLARYLEAQVEQRDDFEMLAPVTLSIACFRYVPADLKDQEPREDYLNRLNERLMTEIQLDGRAYCSNAVVRGRFALRACIVNYRTEAVDIDALLEVATELGSKIDSALRAEAADPA
jgi:glutamate/tyrosine decarboxylase-like PLP-dependent enzyme